MSYDAHLIFDDCKDLEKAIRELECIKVDNKNLFILEPDYQNLKIFF